MQKFTLISRSHIHLSYLPPKSQVQKFQSCPPLGKVGGWESNSKQSHINFTYAYTLVPIQLIQLAKKSTGINLILKLQNNISNIIMMTISISSFPLNFPHKTWQKQKHNMRPAGHQLQVCGAAINSSYITCELIDQQHSIG